MHRFHLPPAECQKSPLTLSERESHHAVNVLRLKPGQRAVVLDGAGQELMCEVMEAGPRRVTLKVAQKNFTPPLPYQVTLLQAITRGKNMDLIVQKAVELGAHRIVPLLAERTTVQLEEEDAGNKVEKWNATAIGAIKQCGSAWLPIIEAPLTPKAWLARGEKFELSLLACLQSDSRHPREYFREFAAEKNRAPESVCVWVGPEGDFTPAEIGGIKSAGARPITLGPLVLRSETAAIYCLAVLNYELQSQQ